MASARCACHPWLIALVCPSDWSGMQASLGPWGPCHPELWAPVVTLPDQGSAGPGLTAGLGIALPAWASAAARHSPGKYLPDAGFPLGGCPHPGPRFPGGTGRKGGRPRHWRSLAGRGLPLPQRIPAVTIQKYPAPVGRCARAGSVLPVGRARPFGQWGEMGTAAGGFPAQSTVPGAGVCPGPHALLRPVPPGALASSPGDRAAGCVHSR